MSCVLCFSFAVVIGGVVVVCYLFIPSRLLLLLLLLMLFVAYVYRRSCCCLVFSTLLAIFGINIREHDLVAQPIAAATAAAFLVSGWFM